ncbi:NAD(P)-dependent dehydrogenase (short-subunit alcohol dehydrogenase family) [Caballeronia udeis]|uniref:NAD(P)-dependent dehydrogenase (Short-subunit alcohol dehydrogenase family) n=1 Tax=Caballeronia udeis TaxID=1232866 RepID=A0ABW8MQX4_9BURK
MNSKSESFFEGRTALVTGANGGLGLALARALADRDCKVYAAVRNPDNIADASNYRLIIPVRLDLTDPDSIDALITLVADVSLVFNNAGSNRQDSALFCRSEGAAREEMEVNFFGPLRLARALAPLMKDRGEGTFVNLLSILAFEHLVECGSYSASKAAAHSLTQGMRAQLQPWGVRVIGVYPGPMDTAMSASLPLPKVSPEVVATAIMSALVSRDDEIYPGDIAQEFHTKWRPYRG